MKNILMFISILSISVSSFAAEENVEPAIIARATWGAKDPKKTLTACNKLSIIVIGHTATKKNTSMKGLQQSQMSDGFDDVGCHFALDCHGKCYEGRPLSAKGALLRETNDTACGIHILGRCDDHADAIEVTDELAKQWGQNIALIAHQLGFEKLQRDENIFGVSEKSRRFPISPGVRLMSKFDMIVQHANDYLEILTNQAQ